MEEMSLHSVNRQLTKLYNEKNYLYDRMEKILSLVSPKSMSIDDIVVDGGKKIDKLLRYTELKEEMIYKERMQYINDKISSLETWKKSELDRLNKFDDLIPKIVHLKEEVFIKDKYSGKIRHLKWKEIASQCYVSEKTARNKYNIGIQARNNKNNINISENKKAH